MDPSGKYRSCDEPPLPAPTQEGSREHCAKEILDNGSPQWHLGRHPTLTKNRVETSKGPMACPTESTVCPSVPRRSQAKALCSVSGMVYCSSHWGDQQNQLSVKSSIYFCLSFQPHSASLLGTVEAAFCSGLGRGRVEKGGQPEESQSTIQL